MEWLLQQAKDLQRQNLLEQFAICEENYVTSISKAISSWTDYRNRYHIEGSSEVLYWSFVMYMKGLKSKNCHCIINVSHFNEYIAIQAEYKRG